PTRGSPGMACLEIGRMRTVASEPQARPPLTKAGPSLHNADIAAVLYRLAELLEIEGGNPFRVRAYRRAAATLEDLTEPVSAWLAAGRDLAELPGIGED